MTIRARFYYDVEPGAVITRIHDGQAVLRFDEQATRVRWMEMRNMGWRFDMEELEAAHELAFGKVLR